MKHRNLWTSASHLGTIRSWLKCTQ
uniref:Uncharacterized protein n=1 Tax=Anguilla anguilla TaxID=7936 RepID=A0A0E9VLH2_ANGAN